MLTELGGAAGVAVGASSLLVALLMIARVLWLDGSAARRIDAYTKGLEVRVRQLEVQLDGERDRRRAVEGALDRAGIPLPVWPERRVSDFVPEQRNES